MEKYTDNEIHNFIIPMVFEKLFRLLNLHQIKLILPAECLLPI
jgi:hypothetical protein